MESLEGTASSKKESETGKTNSTSSELSSTMHALDADEQKSNGVAESADTSQPILKNVDKEAPSSEIAVFELEKIPAIDSRAITSTSGSEDVTESNIPDSLTASSTSMELCAVNPESSCNIDNNKSISDEVDSKQGDVPKINPLQKDVIGSASEEEINDTIHNDNVTFETEVLVEANDNDVNELNLNDTKTDGHVQESTNNILNELGQNIELSEALRSADNTENVENNNQNVGQEVFNKEELLDILEGNDIPPPGKEVEYKIEVNMSDNKMTEAQLAFQQLSNLKKKARKPRNSDLISKKKKIILTKKKEELPSDTNEVKKDESIVNVLVKDWEDDELGDESEKDKSRIKCVDKLSFAEQIITEQESIVYTEENVRTSIDSTTEDNLNQNHNKSNDESQPQRRLGRVIKKKVIFDPDNPDTFTKSKIAGKIKEMHLEKEEPPSKKGKTDQITHRPKSKSPVSKLQWKKPSPKNIKQNKRLTEIDKLLMDEGAVNMIYQLTPEAPKGKKNMKTKAEFIKKLQSSTPESKEMKFRERKKEIMKSEEGEAKKILSGKQRSSLSSSVKSPSVCEDFETHSADDSIIYRRHSSSSYSSTCMSPRRLSDVEMGMSQNLPLKIAKEIEVASGPAEEDSTSHKSGEIFIPVVANISSSNIINKDDCLSIKEKLNTKLALALNKRKRESLKTDKPPKQKKVSKDKPKIKDDVNKYKYLSVTFNQRVAQICICMTGLKCSVEMLKELQQVLQYVDTRKDISVTLLTSECGMLCPELDLQTLLDDNMEKRINSAYELAESVRSLLCSMMQHSKLVCTGVWSACSGVALALVALSDIAIASESASFSLATADGIFEPVQPGVTVLSARSQPLHQSLINDLVIFGRRVPAAEALRGGLLSRVLWPHGFYDQLRGIINDIAAQPASNLLLKKRLLTLKNVSNTTFLSCLEKERDLMVEYWTSAEMQESLRATISNAA